VAAEEARAGWGFGGIYLFNIQSEGVKISQIQAATF
jgi:hypothetical protein